MEGSGSLDKKINCFGPDGEEVTTYVISSRDTVEIGGWTFNRTDLLFALNAPIHQENHD